MYIYSIENRDTVSNFVLQEIRNNLGISLKQQNAKVKKLSAKRLAYPRTKIFNRPIDQLPCQSIQLQCGAVVDIPSFVIELCTILRQHLETEGLFRKAGSTARQREIKAHVEAGGALSNDNHEVDLANILKMFLRELPDPLLPFQFHEIFLKSLEHSKEQLLSACLLLPPLNLSTLAYLMEFLKDLGDRATMNLMPASNLAIVLTPAVMPVADATNNTSSGAGKLTNHAQRHEHHIHILQALIEEALRIGKVPKHILEHLGLTRSADEESVISIETLDGSLRRGKKRRSGSLTRVLNVVRKMVGGRNQSPSIEDMDREPATPGQSPCIKSAKKRRALDTPNGGLSAKKKREVLQILPESAVLANTPVRPCMQPLHLSETPAQPCLYATPPVCSHPNPLKSVVKSPHPQHCKIKHRSRFFTPSKSRSESILQRVVTAPPEQKKVRLSFGYKKSSKKQALAESKDKEKEKEGQVKQKKSWSSLGGSWGRSMRKLAPTSTASAPTLLSQESSLQNHPEEASPGLGGATAKIDLSPVSNPLSFHTEYEEIKSKVSSLEHQLNQELNKAEMAASNEGAHTASFVQSAYERALEDSEPFNNSHSTEQLAKRLSKELKIRRSGENKVIRSPSARKIGSLRRRSRESARPLVRTPSFNRGVRNTVPIPRSLKRGRPNTVLSGLSQPSPALLQRPVSNSQSILCDTTWKSPSESSWGQSNKSGYVISQSPFCGPITRSQVQRASSFHGLNDKQVHNTGDIKKALSFNNIVEASPKAISEEGHWKSAEEFLNKGITPRRQAPQVGRPSIAEIKHRRAGMVLASVRLFDTVAPSQESKSNIIAGEVNPSKTMEAVASPVVSKLKNNFLNTSNSPKKIGSPRKNNFKQSLSVSSKNSLINSIKNSPPNFVRNSPSPKKSLTKTPNIMTAKPVPHSDEIQVKSNRLPQRANSTPKTNLKPNMDWRNAGKENLPSPSSPFYLQALKSQFSPQMKLPEGLKDCIYAVCTPHLQQPWAKSPLRDSNRIPTSQRPATPQKFPSIKKPLSVRPIISSTLRRTPHGLDTPSKFVSRGQPLTATPLRRSPRLLLTPVS